MNLNNTSPAFLKNELIYTLPIVVKHNDTMSGVIVFMARRKRQATRFSLK